QVWGSGRGLVEALVPSSQQIHTTGPTAMTRSIQTVLKNVLLALVSVIVTLVLFEGMYRLATYGYTGTFRKIHQYDSVLGWRMSENYRRKPRTVQDHLGHPYERS